MRRLVPWILPGAVLLAWALVTASGVIDARFLPSPIAVLHRGFGELAGEDFASHLLTSLLRNFEGCAIGIVAGLAFGLPLGFSPLLRKLFGPMLIVNRQIALFAWIPLLSMWFGGGELGKLSFIALAAFQPMLMNTWQGVRTIPAAWRELGAVLTLGWLDRLRMIVLPAASPALFTGLHTALLYGWVATVGAELLLDVAPGIGGRMNEGQHLFQMDLVLLCLFLLGATGVTLNVAAAAVERRFIRWRPV